MEKFNYEEFNYEDAYNNVKEEIKEANIFICGASQIGKSSLVNEILDLSGAKKSKVGNSGVGTTRNVHLYSSQKSSVNLYDSEGYEVGEEKQRYYKKEILSFIEKQRRDYPEDMSKHIHEVWYCISAANKKYLEIDRQLLNEIIKQDIPLMIILTKVDCIDVDELDELRVAITKDFPQIPIFTYSTNMKIDENGITEEEYKKYVQKEEIIEWAKENLDEYLQTGLLAAVHGGLMAKRNYILSKLLPKYVTAAGTAVSAASFIPVPFSDSVPLMAIQVKMSMHIFKVYGIENVKSELLGSILQTQLVSYVGKTVANQIWLAIPFVGNFARAAVNVGTATMITATVGAAIALVAEKYLQECVDSDGKSNIAFADFFTKDKLKEAIKWLQENNDGFGDSIKEMAESIGEKYLQKNKGR